MKVVLLRTTVEGGGFTWDGGLGRRFYLGGRSRAAVLLGTTVWGGGFNWRRRSRCGFT
jgi:hypothetical protein